MTHCETTRNGVEADVDLMNEIGRLRDTHQWTSGVDILHPPIDLLVRSESKIYQFLLCFQFDAEWLEVHSLHIDNVSQIADESG